MDKLQLIKTLQVGLKKMPAYEIDRTISYYLEAVDDRMEDGMTEHDAVASLGDIDQIISETLIDMPITTLIKERIDSSRERASSEKLWKVLAVCSFPITVPLLFALVVTIAALGFALFAVIVSLLLVVFALALCGAVGLIGGFYCMLGSNILTGIALIGAGVAALGLASSSVRGF